MLNQCALYELMFFDFTYVITALISKESAKGLDLKDGDDVTAIIKSTEVIVGK